MTDTNENTASRTRRQGKIVERMLQQENCQNEDSNMSDQGGRTRGSRRLRLLDNSDKFMANFDPEKSTREMRKIQKRVYKESGRRNRLFDEEGRFLENSRDICDCLVVDCPGCHFPCPKCGSEKCGLECRCNRRWFYEQVEVEGTTVCLKWPSKAEGSSTTTTTTTTPEDK